MKGLLSKRSTVGRGAVRRLRTPDFTWDDARHALDTIFWHGLQGADRAGLYRRNFFGFQVRVRDVATALAMLFRGEALFVRTPQSRYEKIRDLQDLKEMNALWGSSTRAARQERQHEEYAIARVA